MAYDPVSCESRYLNVVGKSLLIFSCGGRFPILEELSLRALKSVKQICDVYEPLANETCAERGPVVSLTFDTSVTGNRERAFVMYDDADLQVELSPSLSRRRRHCRQKISDSYKSVRKLLVQYCLPISVAKAITDVLRSVNTVGPAK